MIWKASLHRRASRRSEGDGCVLCSCILVSLDALATHRCHLTGQVLLLKVVRGSLPSALLQTNLFQML
jgi:hypothetical protein